MRASIKTKRFNINLKSPYTTFYTAVAENEKRVVEMLEEELNVLKAYKIEDFEIDDMGPAKDQMRNYFQEEFNPEM